MNVWIDIENPPQVQYLTPFKLAFEERGHDVVVTARNASITLDLLRHRQIEPILVHAPTESSTARKLIALSQRAWRLRRRLSPYHRDVALTASRAGIIASWAMRIPCFAFYDYEHVDLRAAKLARAYVLHPDVIPSDTFVAAGFRHDRLVPYPGLKEAITFAGVDLEHVEPIPLLHSADGAIPVLFRPPGESTHYFVPESLRLSLELLAYLAKRHDVLVVYAPRDHAQVAYVEGLDWINSPIVLERGAPFLSLLTSVDAVISSGGTMLREAAYLGIPAYSVFRSETGQVDRYLESLGRLTFIGSKADFAKIRMEPARLDPMPARTRDLVGDLAEEIVGRASELRHAA